MAIQPPQASFIPCFQSHTSPEDSPECTICTESLSNTPNSAGLLPIKHEGPLGAQHEAMHLQCCLEWMRQSDLCSYCKTPLNKDQLTLLLDNLQKRDITALSPQDFEEAATLAKEQSETLDKTLIAAIHLLFEEKILDSIVLDFKTSSENSIETLVRASNQLDIQLGASSMKEYLRAESVFRLKSSELSETGDAFNISLQRINEAFKNYQLACRIYVTKELVFEDRLTERTLQASSGDNPLSAASSQEMQQKAQDFLRTKLQFGQMKWKIEELTARYRHLKDAKCDDKAVTLLVMSFAISCIWAGTERDLVSIKGDALPIRLFLGALTSIFLLMAVKGIPDGSKKVKNVFFYATLPLARKMISPG